MKTILVTGAAGFIGAHLTQRLTQAGVRVVGLDNINDYYDPQLKRDRMAALAEGELFVHENLDIADRPGMQQLFERYR
ncbi:MAG: NAD-dependent epimerase/dehydratase family protein, partial [Desulfofustis sp.]|nr:NAD-dependent epimerase/dehydratase family protein [Desulfofustis sp.]